MDRLMNDGYVFIKPGVEHEVINVEEEETLKLYTIYSPPVHEPGLVQLTAPKEEEHSVRVGVETEIHKAPATPVLFF
jgi:hypothetical protein